MTGARQLGRSAWRRLVGDRGRVESLEAKVSQLKRKILDLEERRVLAQFTVPYVEGPRFRLDYDGAEIDVVAPARQRTARAQLKEPLTVSWLERTFSDGDVLYDIGANVGSYSLIAATIAPSAHVVAFEPSFAAFPVLCSNIALNDLGGRVLPIQAAVGRTSEVGTLHYRELGPGAAATRLAPSDSRWEQDALVFRLDDLVRLFALGSPTHIRLRPASVAADVVAGAVDVLAGGSVRSILLALTDEADSAVIQMLVSAGFVAQHRAEDPAGRNRYQVLERAGSRVGV